MSPSSKNIILSLHNEYYKQIMWSHYRLLGKTNNANTELSMANTVLDLFKDKLTKTNGYFFKQAGCGNSFKNLEEIDEEMALAKILSHIQRRMKNYDSWSQCEGDDAISNSPIDTTPNTKTTNSVSAVTKSLTKETSNGNDEILSQFSNDEDHDNNVILSLHNDYYKRIMWSHFRILGKDRDLDTEKLIGETVFDIFKKKISSSPNSVGNKSTMRRGRQCGKFYKLNKTCTTMEEVDDDAALAKIIADIQRRLRNHAVWSAEEEVVINEPTITDTACASTSSDADADNAGKANDVAIVSKNCTPAQSPITVARIGSTERMNDATATQHHEFNPLHPTPFNEALKAAIDSYHKNHTLLKTDNNPPPPVPPPFLSHEEECTIKTALAFVMARARIKSRKERNVSLSGGRSTTTDDGVGESIISNRCDMPSFLGGLSMLPSPRCVSSIPRTGCSNFCSNSYNLQVENKLKHVRDVLKLAVSAVLPFYKDALKVNACGLCNQNRAMPRSSNDDDVTTLEPNGDPPAGKRPCAVYDYEAAVESSNNGSHHQNATIDGLCQHIIMRLFSLIRDESLKSRSSRVVGRNGDGESAVNDKSGTNGEAPTVVSDQSRGNASNGYHRGQHSGEQTCQNFASNAIVKLIYNDLIGDAYLHHGPTNSPADARECAERRIEKIMSVCHVLHRLFFLDNGCCLGTECVTAICFILSDLYLNQYRGVKFMKQDNGDSVAKQNMANENVSSAKNAEKSDKQLHNSNDGERYQVVPSRWCNSSSRSYINQRHDRRRQSVNAMTQGQLYGSDINCDKRVDSSKKEEHPLPCIGDVLAVNLLRLLEGAAAIRIHHRQQRVPSSTTSSRHHYRELMIDKVVRQTATEVLSEIRASMDHELMLPLHVEDAASFYYTEKTRAAKIIRESRGRTKSVGDTSMVLLQPGAKIMMRLHLFELTNKLALYE